MSIVALVNYFSVFKINSVVVCSRMVRDIRATLAFFTFRSCSFLLVLNALPNTDEGKQQERKHVTNTLMSNGYPKKFLHQVEQKGVMHV